MYVQLITSLPNKAVQKCHEAEHAETITAIGMSVVTETLMPRCQVWKIAKKVTPTPSDNPVSTCPQDCGTDGRTSHLAIWPVLCHVRTWYVKTAHVRGRHMSDFFRRMPVKIRSVRWQRQEIVFR